MTLKPSFMTKCCQCTQSRDSNGVNVPSLMTKLCQYTQSCDIKTQSRDNFVNVPSLVTLMVSMYPVS